MLYFNPIDLYNFNDYVKGMRLSFSKKDIRVVRRVYTDCPNCIYDPINQASTNINCSTCSGRGKLETEKIRPMKAMVRWRLTTDEQQEKGGTVYPGDCTIIIDQKQIININDIIRVDGEEVRVTDRIKRGIIDNNRIVLTCTKQYKDQLY